MSPSSSYNGRALLCVALIFTGFIGLMARTAILCSGMNSKQNKNLKKIAQSQYEKPNNVAHYRGNIYDRNMTGMAISVRRPSVWIDSRKFKPTQKQLGRLSSLSGVSVQKIRALTKKKRAFVYLKRKITSELASKIKKLKIPGVKFEVEPHRVYPNADLGAELIGFVDIDNNGLTGLEKQFDRQLRGKITETKPEVDAHLRKILMDRVSAKPETPGHHIVLSIDHVIQGLAEDALKWGVERSDAKGGWVVVADPHTGAVLAVANYDRFSKKPKKQQRNKALVDIWEPGSLTKAMLVTAALETNKFTLNQYIDCEKGKKKVGRHTIHDTHEVKDATIRDVIVHSSNVCAYKIAEKIGPALFYQHLKDFGLADRSWRFKFPGYTQGRLSPFKSWRPIRFANIAFGQGFLTNSLELIRAFSTIANGGKYYDPFILERVEADSGQVLFQKKPSFKQLLEPSIANKIKGVLNDVVTFGSGRNANIKGVGVGGKTGTAQKADLKTKRYSQTDYLASFFGFTPTKASTHLTIGVVIDSPNKTPHYGGLWAAPVFKKIATSTLKYMNLLHSSAEETLDVSTKTKASNKL